MDVFYNNANTSNNRGSSSPEGMSPPSTDEEGGLMLASAYPKKRAGRKKFKETRHPVYRGVRQRNSGKWVCEVREPNKKSRIWLGTFPTSEMAARAHDVAAMALRGRYGACLNFADSAWRFPVLPPSSDTKDIQRAAAEAAEEFRPRPQHAEEVVTVSITETTETETTTMNTTTTTTTTANNAASGSSGEEMMYIDEDAFGMPGLVAEMYHGMGMLPPDWSNSFDNEMEGEVEAADLPLWSYSLY